MSAEEDEELSSDGNSEDVDLEDEEVYMYRVPLATNGVTKESEYSTGSPNKTYITYYGTDECVVIQDTAAGHLHRDDVNASVEMLDKSEVEESDNLLADFIK